MNNNETSETVSNPSVELTNGPNAIYGNLVSNLGMSWNMPINFGNPIPGQGIPSFSASQPILNLQPPHFPGLQIDGSYPPHMPQFLLPNNPLLPYPHFPNLFNNFIHPASINHFLAAQMAISNGISNQNHLRQRIDQSYAILSTPTQTLKPPEPVSEPKLDKPVVPAKMTILESLLIEPMDTPHQIHKPVPIRPSNATQRVFHQLDPNVFSAIQPHLIGFLQPQTFQMSTGTELSRGSTKRSQQEPNSSIQSHGSQESTQTELSSSSTENILQEIFEPMQRSSSSSTQLDGDHADQSEAAGVIRSQTSRESAQTEKSDSSTDKIPQELSGSSSKSRKSKLKKRENSDSRRMHQKAVRFTHLRDSTETSQNEQSSSSTKILQQEEETLVLLQQVGLPPDIPISDASSVENDSTVIHDDEQSPDNTNDLFVTNEISLYDLRKEYRIHFSNFVKEKYRICSKFWYRIVLQANNYVNFQKPMFSGRPKLNREEKGTLIDLIKENKKYDIPTISKQLVVDEKLLYKFVQRERKETTYTTFNKLKIAALDEWKKDLLRELFVESSVLNKEQISQLAVLYGIPPQLMRGIASLSKDLQDEIFDMKIGQAIKEEIYLDSRRVCKKLRALILFPDSVNVPSEDIVKEEVVETFMGTTEEEEETYDMEVPQSEGDNEGQEDEMEIDSEIQEDIQVTSGENDEDEMIDADGTFPQSPDRNDENEIEYEEMVVDNAGVVAREKDLSAEHVAISPPASQTKNTEEATKGLENSDVNVQVLDTMNHTDEQGTGQTEAPTRRNQYVLDENLDVEMDSDEEDDITVRCGNETGIVQTPGNLMMEEDENGNEQNVDDDSSNQDQQIDRNEKILIDKSNDNSTIKIANDSKCIKTNSSKKRVVSNVDENLDEEMFSDGEDDQTVRCPGNGKADNQDMNAGIIEKLDAETDRDKEDDNTLRSTGCEPIDNQHIGTNGTKKLLEIVGNPLLEKSTKEVSQVKQDKAVSLNKEVELIESEPIKVQTPCGQAPEEENYENKQATGDSSPLVPQRIEQSGKKTETSVEKPSTETVNDRESIRIKDTRTGVVANVDENLDAEMFSDEEDYEIVGCAGSQQAENQHKDTNGTDELPAINGSSLLKEEKKHAPPVKRDAILLQNEEIEFIGSGTDIVLKTSRVAADVDENLEAEADSDEEDYEIVKLAGPKKADSQYNTNKAEETLATGGSNFKCEANGHVVQDNFDHFLSQSNRNEAVIENDTGNAQNPRGLPIEENNYAHTLPLLDQQADGNGKTLVVENQNDNNLNQIANNARIIETKDAKEELVATVDENLDEDIFDDEKDEDTVRSVGSLQADHQHKDTNGPDGLSAVGGNSLLEETVKQDLQNKQDVVSQNEEIGIMITSDVDKVKTQFGFINKQEIKDSAPILQNGQKEDNLRISFDLPKDNRAVNNVNSIETAGPKRNYDDFTLRVADLVQRLQNKGPKPVCKVKVSDHNQEQVDKKPLLVSLPPPVAEFCFDLGPYVRPTFVEEEEEVQVQQFAAEQLDNEEHSLDQAIANTSSSRKRQLSNSTAHCQEKLRKTESQQSPARTYRSRFVI